MSAPFPAVVDGKTRRPDSFTRPDYRPVDPRADPHPDKGGGTMARCAFFRFREDAVAVGKEWCEPDGWVVWPQYMGRYDLWVLTARRKSWRTSSILVEACLHPDVQVTRHAHVPIKYTYERLDGPQ